MGKFWFSRSFVFLRSVLIKGFIFLGLYLMEILRRLIAQCKRGYSWDKVNDIIQYQASNLEPS